MKNLTSRMFLLICSAVVLMFISVCSFAGEIEKPTTRTPTAAAPQPPVSQVQSAFDATEAGQPTMDISPETSELFAPDEALAKTEKLARAMIWDASSLPTHVTKQTVSDWLETRIATENVASAAKAPAPLAVPFFEGGGWCDRCGCWMRHGADPNGNDTIGHAQVCSANGMSCNLHPGDCSSSDPEIGP